MSKVYLVSSGSYSDYHIVAVCSDMEKAEYARKLYGGDSKYCDIQDFEIDNLPERPNGLWAYEVHMKKNGDTVVVSPISMEDIDEQMSFEWNPHWRGNNGVLFNLWAKDEKHAIKIANEKRTQLIANNIWTENHTRFQELFNQGLVK